MNCCFTCFAHCAAIITNGYYNRFSIFILNYSILHNNNNLPEERVFIISWNQNTNFLYQENSGESIYIPSFSICTVLQRDETTFQGFICIHMNLLHPINSVKYLCFIPRYEKSTDSTKKTCRELWSSMSSKQKQKNQNGQEKPRLDWGIWRFLQQMQTLICKYCTSIHNQRTLKSESYVTLWTYFGKCDSEGMYRFKFRFSRNTVEPHYFEAPQDSKKVQNGTVLK